MSDNAPKHELTLVSIEQGYIAVSCAAANELFVLRTEEIANFLKQRTLYLYRRIGEQAAELESLNKRNADLLKSRETLTKQWFKATKTLRELRKRKREFLPLLKSLEFFLGKPLEKEIRKRKERRHGDR